MAEKAKKKENFFARTGNRVSKFFRDTKGEIKKMVWPTPQSVFKNTGVVLVTILVIGLFVFGLDTLLVNLLSLIMNVAH
ncbi:MAG TPA: preprotein translocase subunit SecE [Ruminococcaceae bacterium]|jgi:preprotein translocase subunit SecE|nr:preprotein translocase subunit SecE [Oscillospiraceae bacterium]HBG56109.1 preprotein translocase subunit SecE [Oscillospiraceae bacterium]HBQ46000.1 preprotein translocase subunit SecE [Oscillospiraceae bacterium]HBT91250.1 preprotein translocase subunit SecE [Oscillospiraceae bacterium]HCB91204.1 preprotein translocase subunit SecE [Oscillospiraceae bacterium]